MASRRSAGRMFFKTACLTFSARAVNIAFEGSAGSAFSHRPRGDPGVGAVDDELTTTRQGSVPLAASVAPCHSAANVRTVMSVGSITAWNVTFPAGASAPYARTDDCTARLPLGS